jgi:peptidoglycan/xylan/chitin deacetylase (PgdA/CDA1 family)
LAANPNRQICSASKTFTLYLDNSLSWLQGIASRRPYEEWTHMSIQGRRTRILMYHSIANLDNDPNMLCTSPERFEAQMRHLERHNLRGVSITELRRAMSTGDDRNLVGLTFDDGYKDFLHTAMPVLESLGFSATVFVVVGMLGKENRWKHTYNPRPRMELLGAMDLHEVTRRGMEVGSHSVTHPDLSGLKPQLLESEVKDSRQMLGELLGKEVEGFCYPYGSLDRTAVEAVRQAGYAYACGWRTQPEHSVYDWPRIPVSERDNDLRLAVKLKVYPQYSWVARNLYP